MDDRGVTLVELLVVMVLLSIVLFFFVLARRLGGRSEKRAKAGVGKAARTSVGTK